MELFIIGAALGFGAARYAHKRGIGPYKKKAQEPRRWRMESPQSYNGYEMLDGDTYLRRVHGFEGVYASFENAPQDSAPVNVFVQEDGRDAIYVFHYPTMSKAVWALNKDNIIAVPRDAELTTADEIKRASVKDGFSVVHVVLNPSATNE